MTVSILLVISYVSAAVVLVAVAWRFVKLSTLPIHLRWELYPVAHEKDRASYGGSYLEEPDWWTKPRHSSLIGELKVMIPEILLLAGVWEHNRRHWFRSFPFHIGLYLAIGLIGLLTVGAIATAAGTDVSADAAIIWKLLHHATYVIGYAAVVLGLIGATALLCRRMFEPDYAEYTRQVDYFNLVFFVVTFAVALAAHVVGDRDFAVLRSFFAELVLAGSLSATERIGLLSSAEIVLASLLAAYIPLTHMSHFFTKWFTYHHVRWADEPNMPGSKIEQQVNRALQYPVSWSAPHIRGDGKKTWVDVATSGVEEETVEKR